MAQQNTSGLERTNQSIDRGIVAPVLDQLAGMGGGGAVTPEATRQALDNMTQGQSVMLATNEIMAFVAMAFLFSALLIWLAPRPTRKVEMGAAH